MASWDEGDAELVACFLCNIGHRDLDRFLRGQWPHKGIQRPVSDGSLQETSGDGRAVKINPTVAL